MALPFEEDELFDVVVCQFAVMFYPDRFSGYVEAYRVLKPGGTLIFNVWDRIETNEFADMSYESLDAISSAPSPRDPAVAYCQGTPLRNEIEQRDADHLEHVTERAAATIADRFGNGNVAARIRGHIIAAQR